MLIILTGSEDTYQHIQGKTSRKLWLSLKRAYAPITLFHEFTLKRQLLRITMKGDEKPTEYLRAELKNLLLLLLTLENQ